MNRISRNEKRSHRLTRIDTGKERISKLKSRHEDDIPEGAR